MTSKITIMDSQERRFGARRAVSPIIAMILLVAITVVLAAVLYVLISGQVSAPTASEPPGFQLGLANPVTESGTGTGFCASGTTCYTVQIAAVNSALDCNRFVFALHDPKGNPVTPGAGG